MTKKSAPAQQIAALPVHWDSKGRLRVLMVTSRETRRWVMPKGWLIDGKKPWRAAEIEALEEAGAVGHISSTVIGTYHYEKILDKNASVRCRVTVYPMLVERLKRRWKERNERKRHWFSPKKAAKLVDEAELTALLSELADRQPGKEALLNALDLPSNRGDLLALSDGLAAEDDAAAATRTRQPAA